MRYGQVFYADPANGIGCRISLFVSGCRHHCKGCFNPETWDFNYGELFDWKTADDLIANVGKPYIDGISILGGEPMEPENQEELYPFLGQLKYLYPEKTVWIYTGCKLEELLADDSEEYYIPGCTMSILRMTDILVDGPFIEELKDITLRFRGSSNQRVIDMKKTLESGKVVLSPYGDKR